MKALTLRHPWPFAVCHLEKRVENRDWDDRLAELFGIHHLIGETVAIHGGSAPQPPKGRKHWRELSKENPYRKFREDLEGVHALLDGELPGPAAQFLMDRCPSGTVPPEAFILPGIVAVAVVQGVTRASRDPWAAQGQLHILLDQVVVLPKPVECRGAQGLWEVPEVIADEVTERYRAVLDARPPQFGERDGAAWLR